MKAKKTQYHPDRQSPFFGKNRIAAMIRKSNDIQSIYGLPNPRPGFIYKYEARPGKPNETIKFQGEKRRVIIGLDVTTKPLI